MAKKLNLVLNVIFRNSNYGGGDRYAHVDVNLMCRSESGSLDSLYEFEHKAARFGAFAQGSRMDQGLMWYAHRLGFRPEHDGVATLHEARRGVRALTAVAKRVDALHVPGSDSLGHWLWRIAAALKVNEVRVWDSETRKEQVVGMDKHGEVIYALADTAARALERCK